MTTTASQTTTSSAAPVVQTSPTDTALPEAPPEPFPEGTALKQGAALPDTPLKQIGGAPFSLAALRGKAVLLNLWATWCAPCRGETPELAQLAKENRARGLEVVGVSVDDATTDDKAVVDFAKGEGVDYTIVRQPGQELMTAINTPVLPTTILLDKSGNVQWLKIGPLRHDDPRVVAALEKVLR